MFADVLISKRRKLVLGVIIATKQEKKNIHTQLEWIRFFATDQLDSNSSHWWITNTGKIFKLLVMFQYSLALLFTLYAWVIILFGFQSQFFFVLDWANVVTFSETVIRPRWETQCGVHQIYNLNQKTCWMGNKTLSTGLTG